MDYSYSTFGTWNDCDDKPFLGFTDLLELNGFDSYFFDPEYPQQQLPPSSGQTLLPPPTSPVFETSEVLNIPATPNSSSISSSRVDPTTAEEQADKSNKQLKPQKKNEKRQRQPRFAFITKSHVDHLEDGYRWRKYGQKAVKNSPFPRSYYRCTNTTCTVKKRVERSSDDQTLVVTTYEGRHTHLTPVTPRSGMHLSSVLGDNLYPSTAVATTFDTQGQMMSVTHPHNQQQQQQYPYLQSLQPHFDIPSFVHERGFNT